MKIREKDAINAIENAGTWLRDMDLFSELSTKEVKTHNEIGKLIYSNPERVWQFIKILQTP